MSATLDDVKVTQQHASRPPPNALGINVEKPKFPQYAICSKRMESFDLWPEYLPVQKKDMIEAGLVYTGVGDSVRCYFCGGGLRNWEVGDVPMDEHAKWYPKCPHILLVKGQAYIDRIVRGEKPEIDGEDGTTIKKDSVDSVNHLETAAAQSCIQMDYSREMVSKAIQIFIAKIGNSDFKGKDLCEILFDIEKYPEELSMNINDSKAADKCVEETNGVVKEEETLGVGDSVRCYFCGGGLRNWESGDVPMEEHAKWYPKCPHILLVKGQAYIERLVRRERPGTDGEDGITSKQDSVDSVNHLETDAAQSCIQMNYKKEMVAKAIKIFIAKNGNSDFKGKDLCEILFDIEENSEELEKSISDGNEVNKCVEETNEIDNGDEKLEPLETLLEENHRLKENQMCKICLDNRADVIFLPCGQLSTVCPSTY